MASPSIQYKHRHSWGNTYALWAHDEFHFHGPPTRYVKLWVAHAPGMPGTARVWRACRDACRDRKLAVSFEVSGGGNIPGIPGTCATRNFTYLVRGPCYNQVTIEPRSRNLVYMPCAKSCPDRIINVDVHHISLQVYDYMMMNIFVQWFPSIVYEQIYLSCTYHNQVVCLKLTCFSILRSSLAHPR